MDDASTTSLYECPFCGAASIAVPNPLTIDASIHCGGCGTHIASWTEFRILVERIIHEGGIFATSCSECVVDPLRVIP